MKLSDVVAFELLDDEPQRTKTKPDLVAQINVEGVFLMERLVMFSTELISTYGIGVIMFPDVSKKQIARNKSIFV
ncbi:hypothetical protein [Ligilactobacillus equi]|uniref:Uncharacterized protein n=1 Tax=Ligilactobacillus equi DSM 15833 = JCM 10991 TaxID=1423740 RepID=A0A0R1T5K9_9LACO|nr:hypothetical protein [Ligilactobacillus equi]KRL76030.1 hypothetical protein FC36_GL002005 [Ligilactobacillus equi DSM 15833 = JCM 10991]